MQSVLKTMTDEESDEQIIGRLEDRAVAVHHAAAAMYIEPLAELLRNDPLRGIGAIVGLYKHALNEAYTGSDGKNERAFTEAVAGGPFEVVPQALCNAVGSVYSRFDRTLRDKALKEILSVLDEINYIHVQEIHTPSVREPLLLSDIAIARRYYWPGLDEGKRLLQEYPLFSNLQYDLMDENGLFRQDKVKSDFCVAYSLLRSDFCEDYVSAANPEFLIRTLKGIIGMRFAGLTDEKKIIRGEARLRELLPVSVHRYIEPIRLKADWVDPELFAGRGR